MKGSAQTGKRGEDLVCSWLRERGHTILERNWRCGHLEIDIISMDSAGIHFVEVKSRKESVQAAPEDSVGIVKQRRVAAAARKYMAVLDERIFGDPEAFFDVAAVVFSGNKAVVEYFPEAFVPMYL